MKKIAALLVMAALFATTAFAQASVGGWLETTGTLSTAQETGSDTDLGDEALKTTSQLGITTLGLTFAYYGDGFGATADLGSWTGGGTTLANPVYENVWIYSDLIPGMFTLYGTVHNLPLKYSPAPAVEGGMLMDLGGWTGKANDDGFGLGFGAYNYQSNGSFVTANTTGVAGEFKMAGLSAALVSSFRDAEQLEDGKVIINAKYDAGIATAYAGFGTEAIARDAGDSFEAVAGNSIWVAVSTDVVEGLMADVKYETSTPSMDDAITISMISANLGYSMDMVSIASEINYSMTSGYDHEDWTNSSDDYFRIGAKISPVVPMVDLSVNATYKSYTQKGADVTWQADSVLYVGLDISKSVGNVSNTLSVGYNTLEWVSEDNEVANLGVSYAINIWF